MPDFDFEAAVRFQKDLERRRVAARRVLFERASTDFQRIVRMIREEFNPMRIYQWGSLLDADSFDESSDIDIAVEGIASARDYLALLKKAEEMTEFPLDLVEMEKVDPLHRDSICTLGRVVYERPG